MRVRLIFLLCKFSISIMPVLAVNAATIKQQGDRFFAEGINNALLCLFISQQDLTISKNDRIKY